VVSKGEISLEAVKNIIGDNGKKQTKEEEQGFRRQRNQKPMKGSILAQGDHESGKKMNKKSRRASWREKETSSEKGTASNSIVNITTKDRTIKKYTDGHRVTKKLYCSPKEKCERGRENSVATEQMWTIVRGAPIIAVL